MRTYKQNTDVVWTVKGWIRMDGVVMDIMWLTPDVLCVTLPTTALNHVGSVVSISFHSAKVYDQIPKYDSCLSIICKQNLWRYLLPDSGRIPDPDAGKAAMEYFGEFRWIQFPESLIRFWENFIDPNHGSCMNFDNFETNNQWALICKEVYWRVSWSKIKIFLDYL